MDAYLDHHVVRIGRGDPLLLLHGLGHSKAAWDPVLAALGGRFDVAAIDLPGFGGAPALPHPPTPAALTDFCAAVMDRLGWDRAHLAGNSLGGRIALRLAARGRASSVTALSPAGQARGWEQTWMRVQLRVVHRLAPVVLAIPAASGTAIGRRLVLGSMFGKPAAMTAGYARASLEAATTATAFQATLDAVADPVEGTLAIDVPVTIAWGTRDVLLLPRQGRRWARAIPGSRLVRLQGLGHIPMPDDPDLITDLIVRTAGQR